MQKSWTPPKNNMRETIEGQPLTGSPKRSVLPMIYSIKIKAMIQERMPTIEAIANGAVENARIP